MQKVIIVSQDGDGDYDTLSKPPRYSDRGIKSRCYRMYCVEKNIHLNVPNVTIKSSPGVMVCPRPEGKSCPSLNAESIIRKELKHTEFLQRPGL